MRRPPFSSAVRPRPRGFSLLELLVAMGILSIVVLALYSMFYQTQKALHNNVGQTDVMENGRSAMQIISGDIERAGAAGVPGVTNFLIRKQYLYGAGYPLPEILDVIHRDAPLNELFYLNDLGGHQWSGLGWFVANATNVNAPVNFALLGALYRLEAPDRIVTRGPLITNDFKALYYKLETAAYRTNYSTLLMDGIVFFRALPYGPSGWPLDETSPTNIVPADVSIAVRNNTLATSFANQALPASVEIELGALPPKLLAQYRTLGNASLQASFLSKHSAELLVFRQRIAIRTATQ